MTTKKLLTAVSLLCLSLSTAWAQGPNGSEYYYKAADGKKGAALKTALHAIIFPHTNIGYDGLYEAYKTTDTRPDGYVRDWYSNATYYTHVKDKAGTYRQEGDCYNREHSVPQSWFEDYEKSSIIKADIVHVLPTDGYVNNRRGNYPLAKVGTWTYRSANNYSKLGNCATPGYSGMVFEPNDEIKGDMARIYFYMATCYEDVVDDWAGNTTANIVFDGTTYPAFKTWYLNMLMEWSKNDPVDEVEIARNNAVKEEQGNRNPFVDYPGLEDYIWGDKKTVAFSYDNYEGSSTGKQFVTMSFSPTSVTAILGENFTAPTLTINPSGLAVTYSSSNTSVATVNSSTGAVTINAVGTTTITASFAGNDDYYANSASYTLTVKQQGGGEPVTVEYEATFNFPEENYGMTALSGNTQDYNPNPTTITSDGVSLTMAGDNSSRYWSTNNTYELRVYKACTMTISAPDNGKITKIVFAGSTISGILNNGKSLSYGTWTGKGSSVVFTFNANQRINTIKITYEVEATEPEVLLGDVNGDGEVTIADVTALVNVLLGKDTAGYNLKAADVNEDTDVTIADVVALVKMILTK